MQSPVWPFVLLLMTVGAVVFALGGGQILVGFALGVGTILTAAVIAGLMDW